MSLQSESANFGDSFIDNNVKDVKNAVPRIKGFNRRGLYRMKQFYDTYKDDEFASPLVTQISWTNHFTEISKQVHETNEPVFLTKNRKDY